jgi:hypothetical protein
MPRNTRTRCNFAAALALCAAFATIARADPVPVRHTQGAVHGFLVIRSQAGANLGYGEFIQDADGDRVTAHLAYHFRDGSLDDETFVYTQRDTFRFVSDHHIQRGRFFPKPSEITVAADGTVTTVTPGKDGQPKTETQHLDLPNDVSNGMIGTLLANFDPHGPPLRLGQVIPFQGKARLIHLDITPGPESSFTIAGTHRKAAVYRLKIDIGGVVGLIAPIVGKQPPEIEAWILEGDAPLFVREVGQLAEDAPIVSIEFAGATFPHTAAPPKKKNP